MGENSYSININRLVKIFRVEYLITLAGLNAQESAAGSLARLVLLAYEIVVSTLLTGC